MSKVPFFVQQYWPLGWNWSAPTLEIAWNQPVCKLLSETRATQFTESYIVVTRFQYTKWQQNIIFAGFVWVHSSAPNGIWHRVWIVSLLYERTVWFGAIEDLHCLFRLGVHHCRRDVQDDQDLTGGKQIKRLVTVSKFKRETQAAEPKIGS